MLLIFYYIQYYNQIPLYTHLCSFWGLFPQDTFLDLELLGQRGAPSEDSRCTLPSASQRGWLPLALPVPATRLSPLSSALTLGRLRRPAGFSSLRGAPRRPQQPGRWRASRRRAAESGRAPSSRSTGPARAGRAAPAAAVFSCQQLSEPPPSLGSAASRLHLA